MMVHRTSVRNVRGALYGKLPARDAGSRRRRPRRRLGGHARGARGGARAAPTSRSSRKCIRFAAIRAPRRAASTPRSARATRWESHAFDTVKGSDYLADQDAVEVMCQEAPARHHRVRAHGRHLLSRPRRQARNARLRRRVAGAHLLRRRHHRVKRCSSRSTIRFSKPASRSTKSGSRPRCYMEDGACRGARRARDDHRRAAPVARQSRHRGERRPRPALRAEHERADLHRRRILRSPIAPARR